MMFGAWAAAIVSVLTAGKLLFNSFVKATRAAVSEEFKKIWREMDDTDRWHKAKFDALEMAIEALKEQVRRLEDLMYAHVNEKK
jgi:polyhydroxyalkanoate synthesis regulator phasin